MNNVRKSSASTLSVMIVFALIVAIRYLIRMIWTDFYVMVEYHVSTISQMGGFHSFIMSFSFWLLLISSAVNAIYNNKPFFRVINAFLVPLLFSTGVVLTIIVYRSLYTDLRWFWLVYYVGMIACLRVSFNRINNPTNLNSSKIIPFLKVYFQKAGFQGNVVDYHVLGLLRTIVAGTFFISIISFAAYCISNREMFMTI